MVLRPEGIAVCPFPIRGPKWPRKHSPGFTLGSSPWALKGPLQFGHFMKVTHSGGVRNPGSPELHTSGQRRSCPLGIGFAFRKPSQRILHGIETLLCAAEPPTPIPVLESFIGPCGKLDDCPCTDRKYQILHTNFLLMFR
jgi:hypothetical protein